MHVLYATPLGTNSLPNGMNTWNLAASCAGCS